MEHLFSTLDLSDRTQLLWRQGKLISDRSDAEHRITLYRLFTFFVEVYCDLDFTTIEDVRLVTSASDLYGYNLGRDFYVMEQN